MLSDDPTKYNNYEMDRKYTGDGVHPNKRGKEFLAKLIAEKAFKDGISKDKALEEIKENNPNILIA